MKVIKSLMPFIGFGILIAGVIITKRSEIGYYLSLSGALIFFCGYVLNSKKSSRKEKTTEDIPYSNPTYKDDNEVLIYDYTKHDLFIRVWYRYNENVLKKTVAWKGVSDDFDSIIKQYQLPKNFLQDYSIDDLYYYITKYEVIKVDYQQFVAYNTILINLFATPFSERKPLRIVEDEIRQKEESARRDAQLEKDLEEHYEFMRKTECVSYYKESVYGERLVSVRKNKETGELFEVSEIPTGLTTGFPKTDPVYVLEQSPRMITQEEFEKKKSELL